MDPRKLFVDERFAAYCVYCGNQPSTRDHVPSKVLLDEPYPENLPVVQACSDCNNNFSKDEPYLACLVECIKTEATDLDSICRPRIKRLLTDKPHLWSLLKSCRIEEASGRVSWEADESRVRNVVLKLARGHVAYECSEMMLEEPERVSYTPVRTLSSEQLRSFETPPYDTVLPEIGSRAFCRTFVINGEPAPDGGWQIVQPGRYRYFVALSDFTLVRFILSEYLACEVAW